MDRNRPSFVSHARPRRDCGDRSKKSGASSAPVCFGSQFTLAKNNRAFRMPALSGGSPENFPFHFVAFPTASLLSLEGFAMVAEVTGVTNIERRVVNLLAHPFLPCPDRRAAVGALVSEAFDHFCPRYDVRNSRYAISVPTHRHCSLCKLLPFDGQNRLLKGVMVRRKCVPARL
jgi:hypothetical protein